MTVSSNYVVSGAGNVVTQDKVYGALSTSDSYFTPSYTKTLTLETSLQQSVIDQLPNGIVS